MPSQTVSNENAELGVERRYWLFKSEPDVFAYTDLERAPQQTTGWEGVRNYLARNYLRDLVKLGDRVLFYHSRIEPIGVVGVCEVVKEAHPDPSQFDVASHYYDPKSKPEAPTWVQVSIQARFPLKRVVPLAELKSTPGLEKLVVAQKGSRLSITPVTPDEFRIILSLAGHADA